tara:strand:- start:487 stop:711 length:225 start_codon:yes stop_codon:yes gene_type:complete
MTTEIMLVIALPVSFLLFCIGALGGWIARDYMMNYQEIPRPHPEMFDENGNLVPDEVIAFRFENNYDYDEEDEN